MNVVPYTNTTKKTQHVGARSVNPGETREVDARFVPAAAHVNVRLVLLYINTTESERFFGETVVKPGEFARVSANYFVDPNTPADQCQQQLFRDVLDQPIPFVSGCLNAFEDDELDVLERIEKESGDKRKGIIEALADERAVRVAERDFKAADYSEQLQQLSDEELDVELLTVADDAEKLVLVQEELANRKAAK